MEPGERQATRPVVHVDPAVAWGRPHIRGVSCEALAGTYAAGEDVEAVCDDYGVTRHELLLALWVEAQHGSYGRRRKRWREWADRVGMALGGHRPLDLDSVEWPTVEVRNA